MKTAAEIKEWATVMAEDSLRYLGSLPVEEVKRIIAENLAAAYNAGVQDEKNRQAKKT